MATLWQLNATAVHWKEGDDMAALKTVIQEYQASVLSTVNALPKFVFLVYAF